MAETTSEGQPLPAEFYAARKANLLALSAPEMTVLVGGLRVLSANYKRPPLACSPGLRVR